MSRTTADIVEGLREAVFKRFTVQEYYLRESGGLEFSLVYNDRVKGAFEELVKEIKPWGYLAVLRKQDDRYALLVAPYTRRIPFKRIMPLALFAATVATIAVDGYFRSTNYPGFNIYTIIGLYTLGILGIIGTHEFGHKVASSRHGMSSSLPFFIPGFPGALPTFGAVIASGEPPVNKDSLFDLGISGPLAGLAITLIVAIGGGLTSTAIPMEQITTQVSQGSLQLIPRLDLFNDFLVKLLVFQPPNTGVVLSPLTFASSLGFLVTFLNLMPAWQLDGGHIARAVFTRRWHRIATFASVGILFALGFQLMAILILVLSMRSVEMQPLDDVSPLSKNRKYLFVSIWVLAGIIYLVTIRDNPFFFR